MASSVERLELYANWSGLCVVDIIWALTNLSKHFIMMRVSAMSAGDFLGGGIMRVALKHAGMTAWLREVLKMSVRTSVRESAQSLSTIPGMLSGPAAFLGFTMSRVLRTSAGSRCYIVRAGRGFCWCGGVVFLKLA